MLTILIIVLLTVFLLPDKRGTQREDGQVSKLVLAGYSDIQLMRSDVIDPLLNSIGFTARYRNSWVSGTVMGTAIRLDQ